MSDLTTNQIGTHKTINPDILDDLCCRFIVNLPREERTDQVRLCFNIELAHWFYLDFYCTDQKSNCKQCTFKEFTTSILSHLPDLRKQHAANVEVMAKRFSEYKWSVPVYGAILVNEQLTNVLLVRSCSSKKCWGFPKGKRNQGEGPCECAAREVFEETGFDISQSVIAHDFILGQVNRQFIQLYIVAGVMNDTQFEAKTRGEIAEFRWFPLNDLPASKDEALARSKLDPELGSFFTVVPFVERIRDWVRNRYRQQLISSPIYPDLDDGFKSNDQSQEKHPDLNDGLEGNDQSQESPGELVKSNDNQESCKESKSDYNFKDYDHCCRENQPDPDYKIAGSEYRSQVQQRNGSEQKMRPDRRTAVNPAKKTMANPTKESPGPRIDHRAINRTDRGTAINPAKKTMANQAKESPGPRIDHSAINRTDRGAAINPVKKTMANPAKESPGRRIDGRAINRTDRGAAINPVKKTMANPAKESPGRRIEGRLIENRPVWGSAIIPSKKTRAVPAKVTSAPARTMIVKTKTALKPVQKLTKCGYNALIFHLDKIK